MKSNFIKNLKIGSGVITFNDFDVDERVPFEQQKYSYKEDMLQIAFGDRFVLDVGWLPDFDPKGGFIMVVILDRDWMNPLLKKTCRSLSDLKKAIEDAAIFIHKAAKENLPPRNVEYEDWD